MTLHTLRPTLVKPVAVHVLDDASWSATCDECDWRLRARPVIGAACEIFDHAQEHAARVGRHRQHDRGARAAPVRHGT
jgi:hypothetical protein